MTNVDAAFPVHIGAVAGSDSQAIGPDVPGRAGFQQALELPYLEQGQVAGQPLQQQSAGEFLIASKQKKRRPVDKNISQLFKRLIPVARVLADIPRINRLNATELQRVTSLIYDGFQYDNKPAQLSAIEKLAGEKKLSALLNLLEQHLSKEKYIALVVANFKPENVTSEVRTDVLESTRSKFSAAEYYRLMQPTRLLAARSTGLMSGLNENKRAEINELLTDFRFNFSDNKHIEGRQRRSIDILTGHRDLAALFRYLGDNLTGLQRQQLLVTPFASGAWINIQRNDLPGFLEPIREWLSPAEYRQQIIPVVVADMPEVLRQRAKLLSLLPGFERLNTQQLTKMAQYAADGFQISGSTKFEEITHYQHKATDQNNLRALLDYIAEHLSRADYQKLVVEPFLDGDIAADHNQLSYFLRGMRSKVTPETYEDILKTAVAALKSGEKRLTSSQKAIALTLGRMPGMENLHSKQWVDLALAVVNHAYKSAGGDILDAIEQVTGGRSYLDLLMYMSEHLTEQDFWNLVIKPLRDGRVNLRGRTLVHLLPVIRHHLNNEALYESQVLSVVVKALPQDLREAAIRIAKIPGAEHLSLYQLEPLADAWLKGRVATRAINAPAAQVLTGKEDVYALEQFLNQHLQPDSGDVATPKGLESAKKDKVDGLPPLLRPFGAAILTLENAMQLSETQLEFLTGYLENGLNVKKYADYQQLKPINQLLLGSDDIELLKQVLAGLEISDSNSDSNASDPGSDSLNQTTDSLTTPAPNQTAQPDDNPIVKQLVTDDDSTVSTQLPGGSSEPGNQPGYTRLNVNGLQQDKNQPGGFSAKPTVVLPQNLVESFQQNNQPQPDNAYEALSVAIRSVLTAERYAQLDLSADDIQTRFNRFKNLHPKIKADIQFNDFVGWDEQIIGQLERNSAHEARHDAEINYHQQQTLTAQQLADSQNQLAQAQQKHTTVIEAARAAKPQRPGFTAEPIQSTAPPAYWISDQTQILPGNAQNNIVSANLRKTNHSIPQHTIKPAVPMVTLSGKTGSLVKQYQDQTSSIPRYLYLNTAGQLQLHAVVEKGTQLDTVAIPMHIHKAPINATATTYTNQGWTDLPQLSELQKTAVDAHIRIQQTGIVPVMPVPAPAVPAPSLSAPAKVPVLP